MFRGIGRLGIAPFSFTFSNGVVSGPNFSFDLNGIVSGLNSAEKDFFRGSPGQLVHFVYEAWNKAFNPQCCAPPCSYTLGNTWDSACLTQAGTANQLSAAGVGIMPSIAAWATSVLGTATPPPAQQPPPATTYTPFPESGGGGGGVPVITPSGPPITGSTAPPDFFGGLGSIGIVAAIAVVILLAVKR